MVNVTVNGNDFSDVNEVRLPITGSSATQAFVPPPSGVMEITANGTHDVSGYAAAEVNVIGAVGGVPFEITGNPVTCYPLAGSDLSVRAVITPVQSGSGDPSPSNIRPISVPNSLVVTHNGVTHNVALPEKFGGGDVDVTGGTTTRRWALMVFDGTESWTKQANANLGNWYYRCYSTDYLDNTNKVMYCSHFKAMESYNNGLCMFINGRTVYANGNASAPYGDVAAWKAYLASEYAAGHPVTLCFSIATPVDSEITPVSMTAAAGANTLACNAQGITVSGYADPIHIIEELTARLATLEDAAVNN